MTPAARAVLAPTVRALPRRTLSRTGSPRRTHRDGLTGTGSPRRGLELQRRRGRHEEEAADLDVEAAAVLALERVAALHRPPRRRERAEADVAVAVADAELRELAHHAAAAHFVALALAVDDDPVPRQQPRRLVAGVRHRDLVAEHEVLPRAVAREELRRQVLLRQVLRRSLDPDPFRRRV